MDLFSRLFGGESTLHAIHHGSAYSQSQFTDVSDSSLDIKTAQIVLAELDVDIAQASHQNCLTRLHSCLHGRSSEHLHPDDLCRDEQCQFGQWLYGAGIQSLGQLPAFHILVAKHRYLHLQASTIAALRQDGEQAQAEHLLHGSYRHAATQLELVFKALCRVALTQAHEG
jgi:hypothetical protein